MMIRKNLKFTFRTLRTRNYRLFFIGQGISLIGTWIQQVALSWLVYRLTRSAFMLGLVAFSGQIPSLLLTPLGGILADRWNRRHILLVTQTSAMIQALVLSALVLTNTITMTHIVILSVMISAVNAFDMPTRHAFVVDMIEKREDLGNAIALNSSIFNGARLVGPSLAGILIAGVGEGFCFLINGLSYLAVIAALLAMHIRRTNGAFNRMNAWQGLREGFVYAVRFKPIFYILLLLGFSCLFGMPYIVLGPVFAKEVLRGDSHTFGFLMGAIGFGALSGAMYLASRKSVVGLERIIPLAAVCFGMGIVIFSFSRAFLLSLVIIAIVGLSIMIQMASSNTLLQTLVDEDKRGRVMSIYTMVFTGLVPFGSLLAGSIASKIGAPLTLLIGGIACLLCGIMIREKLGGLQPMIYQIYIRKSQAPPIPSKIPSLSDEPLMVKE